MLARVCTHASCNAKIVRKENNKGYNPDDGSGGILKDNENGRSVPSQNTWRILRLKNQMEQ